MSWNLSGKDQDRARLGAEGGARGFLYARIMQRVTKVLQSCCTGLSHSLSFPKAVQTAAGHLEHRWRKLPRAFMVTLCWSQKLKHDRKEEKAVFEHCLWVGKGGLQSVIGYVPFSCNLLSNACQDLLTTQWEMYSSVYSRHFSLGSLLLMRKYTHMCNTKWYLLLTPM